MGTMNELLNAAAVTALNNQLEAAAPGTAWTALVAARTGVDGLSLRARSDLISAALISDLPDDYRTVAAVFRRALAGASDSPAGFTGWMIWPVSETVTTLALASTDPDAFDDGLALLAELTPRLTAEFAIRRFLEADLDRALAAVRTWTGHPDEHVRRLASEGTRQYLPWAIRVRALLARPEATLEILEALRSDDSEYVRRSVANHLNDLSRDNADMVAAVAASWSIDADANTRWIVRHGLRTLVKKAHPGALAVMGFETATVRVSPLALDRDTVTLPGELEFSFTVTNESDAASRLAVDYVVNYQKSNGSLAPKVFKLTTVTVAAGESVRLVKKHAFRPMTTRVHYPGAHSLELQINGARHQLAHFVLAG